MSKNLIKIFIPGWGIHPEQYSDWGTQTMEIFDYNFFAMDNGVSANFADKYATMLSMITAPSLLYAHSLGTVFAMKAASESENVKGLVLFSPFAKFAKDDSGNQDGQSPETIDAMIKQLHANPGRLLRNFYRSVSSPEDFQFNVSTTINVQELESGLNFLKSIDCSISASSLRIPVLVICGDKDLIVKTSLSQNLSKIIPNSKVHVFENAGHAIPWTRVKESVALISDFMRENDGQ